MHSKTFGVTLFSKVYCLSTLSPLLLCDLAEFVILGVTAPREAEPPEVLGLDWADPGLAVIVGVDLVLVKDLGPTPLMSNVSGDLEGKDISIGQIFVDLKKESIFYNWNLFTQAKRIDFKLELFEQI